MEFIQEKLFYKNNCKQNKNLKAILFCKIKYLRRDG